MAFDYIYLLVPEGSEVDYEEEPAYTLESLFSDVGGAAGLALGMSLATFFGALEYLMYRFDLKYSSFTCDARLHVIKPSNSFTPHSIYCTAISPYS